LPNGHFNAQCFNCMAFVYRRNGRSCRKHDFLMPRLSAELICRDWRHREGSENPSEIAKYRALEPNVLYYYHYTSDAPPEPLAPFAALKTPVWNVDVYCDVELGWAIRTRREDHPQSPLPGASCTVHLDGAPHRFGVVEAARRRVVGGRRTAAGSWEDTWQERRERLLHCPETPAVLREWLGAQFDVDAHMAAMQVHFFGVSLLDAGIAAFLQALEQPLSYRLQLDCVGNLYRSHKRR